MSYILKDNDQIYIGKFDEIEENQFILVVTNSQEFFSEKISLETLSHRIEECNESIRYKINKVLKTLKNEHPECCQIEKSRNSLRIDLKFNVNSRPLRIHFLVSKCNENEIGSLFFTGLFKCTIENTLLINKMRKVIEAKDEEINDYKQNGATLIREALATKKFNFTDERYEVESPEGQFTFNPDPIITDTNIPDICKMINCRNVLEQSKDKSCNELAQQNTRNSIKVKQRSSRAIIAAKVVDKKFEYINSGDEEDHKTNSHSSSNSSRTKRSGNSLDPIKETKNKKKPKFSF